MSCVFRLLWVNSYSENRAEWALPSSPSRHCKRPWVPAGHARTSSWHLVRSTGLHSLAELQPNCNRTKEKQDSSKVRKEQLMNESLLINRLVIKLVSGQGEFPKAISRRFYLPNCVDSAAWRASCAAPMDPSPVRRSSRVHGCLFACSHRCPMPGSLAPSSD